MSEKKNVNISEIIDKHTKKIEKISSKALKILEDKDEVKKIIDKLLKKIKNKHITSEQLSVLMQNIASGMKTDFSVENLKKFFESSIKGNDKENSEKHLKNLISEYSHVEKKILENFERTSQFIIDQYIEVMKEKNRISELEEEIKKVKEKSEQYLTMSRNLKNDYQRLKERTEREKEEIIKNANEKLLMSFLNIKDDLEKAIESLEKDIPKEQRNYFRGIELVYQKMEKLLEENNVVEIEALGSQFDPAIHEAMMQDNDSEEEEGIITEVFRKGYLFNEKVIRSSLVKVSTGNNKTNNK